MCEPPNTLTHYLLVLIGEGHRKIQLGAARPDVRKPIEKPWLHAGNATAYPLEQVTPQEPRLEAEIDQDGTVELRKTTYGDPRTLTVDDILLVDQVAREFQLAYDWLNEARLPNTLNQTWCKFPTDFY